MLYALPFIIMVLWLIGGQINKGARRFGVPGITVMVSLWRVFYSSKKRHPRFALATLAWLLCIPVLCVGYGIDSWFARVFKKELTIRIVYAIILSIPFLVFERMVGEPWWFIAPTLISLIGAFQVRARSLFHIGKFDVLIEDIARSLVFGGLVSWHLSAPLS